MPSAFFDKELCSLRESITQMGGAVERMLDTALAALRTGDTGLADKTILLDKEINEYDNRITNKTILLIATNQPVAGDLRFLAGTLRMAGELERIGDLSANVARRAKALSVLAAEMIMPDDLDELAVLSRGMLSEALDAFGRRDAALARNVLERDDLVDDLNRNIRRDMVEEIAKDGPKIHWGLEVIYTAAHLERLGDHATNLAEEVIYISSGQSIRHCGLPTATQSSSRPDTLAAGGHANREDLED